MRLILASESPQRRDLLGAIGIHPDRILPTHVDETPLPGERPGVYAQRMARAKAIAALEKHLPGAEGVSRAEDCLILAADTVIHCGRRILAKPASKEQARAHIARLAGRRHRATSAIALIRRSDRRMIEKRAQTVVHMRSLSGDECDRYIETGEWRARSGGYALQGHAARFIVRLNGCWSTVVGLPLAITANALRGLGHRA